MAAVATATATVWSDASSSSSSSSSLPNWVMLDAYVFKRYDLSTFQEDETTTAQCRTSEGMPFRVSFRFSSPPAVSRFYLHLPTTPEGSETFCRIIDSHRNSLLFCLHVPLPLPVDEFPPDFPPESLPRFCRQDFFIYTAGSPPSLTLLPLCPEIPVETDGEEDTSSEELYDPLAGIYKFSELEGVGVLCNDDGHFVVAYLCICEVSIPGYGTVDVEAEMCVYSSSKSEWELLALPIQCEKEAIGDLLRWSTKRVVSFGAYLCWVDYKFGLLFCDVFSDHPQVLYLRMPVGPSPFHEPCVDLYRNICVCEDAGNFRMKFLDAKPTDGYVYLPRSAGFELNIWSLIVKDGKMTWKNEPQFRIAHDDLNIKDLFPCPCGPLIFPLFSMEEPPVVHFVTGEVGHRVKKVWVLSVDLSSKSAEVFPYLNGTKDLLGEDADMAKSKRHCFQSFIPSDITKFFTQITGVKFAVKTHVSLPMTGGIIDVTKTHCHSPSHNHDEITDVLESNARSLLSELPIEFAWNILGHPQYTGDTPNKVLQVSFRLLCPVNIVGGLIGKRGVVIQQIMRGTGASIHISTLHSGCKERAITITAFEGPEQCSKLQGALIHIFERMVEVGRNAQPMLYSPLQSSIRVLLRESQLDYLVCEIAELMDIAGARIQILHGMDIPNCAAPGERVLQITGELFNVSYGLYLVGWKLCDYFFSLNTTNWKMPKRIKYNSEYPSSDFTEMDASISSGGQHLTGVFPRVHHGPHLSCEIEPATVQKVIISKPL